MTSKDSSKVLDSVTAERDFYRRELNEARKELYEIRGMYIELCKAIENFLESINSGIKRQAE